MSETGFFVIPIWRGLYFQLDSEEEVQDWIRQKPHWGWKHGLERSGYTIVSYEEPTYLIPSFVKRSYFLYGLILKVIGRVDSLQWLDSRVRGVLLTLGVIYHRPDFIIASDMNQLSTALKIICNYIDCDIIDFFGDAPSNTSAEREKVLSEADYILTGYPLRHLYPEVEDKIMEVRQGPSELFLGNPASNKDIDIIIFGSFDDDIFKKRTEIIDNFVDQSADRDWNIRVFGNAHRMDDLPDRFAALQKTLEPRLYGPEFADALKRSKIVINIPSDQHINIESQRPMGIFEPAAFGTMQLHFAVEHVQDIFNKGTEIDTFQDVDELVDKVEYYLSHDVEREEMGDESRRRLEDEYLAEKQIVQAFKGR